MPSPVLLIDLDGTLVDTRHDLAAAVNRVLLAEGLETVTIESLGHLFGHGGRAMLAKALADNGIATPERTEIERLNALFVEEYRADIAGLSRPFPGAAETIAALRASGWLTAVCTNKSEALAGHLLERLSLDGLFDALVGGDTFARAKPDAMPLFGAIERAGGARAGSVMLGDSRTDIDAARAAALPVVAVTFGYTDVPVAELEPDVVINAYSELPEALAGLNRESR
ncbi:HAD family hydrolase [Stappia sp.]|uniref:HAD family hydrolase n=1 Tax=Stappia sp. TaxID=1870903 RepID=UPI003A9A199B